MAATAMEIDEFLNGALVSWLESCLPRPEILSGYGSLLDGNIIHTVWLQIDPEPQNHLGEVSGLSGASLYVARARNFECIIRNLRSLFEEEFGQTILVLPNSYTLGFNPDTRQGLEQMKLLLTLLLGAAVQCPNKEIFIGRIKELDVNTQHAIVELIKQVTDNHTLVLTEESIDLMKSADMYAHILRLTKERDDMHAKWISYITSEREASGTNTAQNMQLSEGSDIGTSPSTSSESNQLVVELADLKSKLRKMRQELEEKSETLLEVKEDLEHKVAQYEKLRTESQDWFSEAKRASAYRDEVDVLRERAERADRLEVDIQKLREKLTDAEFYKTRVEELREDNRMLMETKEMLEDQLQRSRKRSEHVMSLESEIIKYKQKLNDMALERDADRNKLEELFDENTQLMLVAKNLNATHEADRSISDNDEECNSGDNSLSEQLTNNAQTRALKLELENRRLLAALDQLKESSFHESTNKILELEKEKKKLSLKLDQMQDNVHRLSQQNKELEDVFKKALEENKKLQDAIDLRQNAYDRLNQERDADRTKMVDLENQVESVKKEKHRLQTLNESIQRRADDLERLVEGKAKEIEQLKQRTEEFKSQRNQLYEQEIKISTLDRENAGLLKEVARLKENLEEKSVQLDEKTIQLQGQSKEVKRLSKNLDDIRQLQNKIQELEQQNVELISQRKVDLETITTLSNDLVSGTLAKNKVKQNLEKLGFDNAEIENSDLNVEVVVEKLVRNPETFKTVREIMLNVTKQQNTKSDMCVLCHRKEIFTVEKNIEITGEFDQPRTVQHSFQLAIPETEKLKETIDQLNTLNNSLETSNDTLQTENARLNVEIATLGSQVTSLTTQQVTLQLNNTQLVSDKEALLKERDTMKHDHKNLLNYQVKLQTLHDQLSAEYESLNNEKEQLKVVVRDLRLENRELKERIENYEKELNELKSQITTMKKNVVDLPILRTEHSKLKEDFRSVFHRMERLTMERISIQEQHKMLRAENSLIKLENTRLTGELSAKNDQLKSLELDYSKSQQCYEMLLQINSDGNIARRRLMYNETQLLSQYRELLTITLDDKQHFHEEEKSYTEKVNNLNRQKEKLEEKIMEQYKKTESSAPKKKAFASSLVRKVKKASSDLINKVPSRNRRSWVEDGRLTQSQSAIGSESGGNESDNSTEEPTSIVSDTHLIQRSLAVRQSLQRNSNEMLENPIIRGGMRSSLQSQKRSDFSSSRRNSIHGLNASDVAESSLTLGAAGSRRTVYVVGENQKIDPNQSPVSSTPEAQTPVNNSANKQTNENSTFVMYNRINTMIGNADNTLNDNENNVVCSNSNGGTPVPNTPQSTNVPSDGKSQSIWYEYGCV